VPVTFNNREAVMAFYMWSGSYSREAMQAFVKSPQNREAVVRQVIEAAGGKLHHAFITLGPTDFIMIAEFPDDVSAVSVSLAVGASGVASSGMTTKLLTLAEFADAMKKAGKAAAAYKAPQ
jgi:uncharacterized protein with GYD domain